MQHFIPSPRETLLPHLSPEQVAALPYPPHLLPGGRDVNTPYGTMRVYEWGPDNGKKVVLIHGDTTPIPVLGPIADTLAQNRCRVLMFDLWGHGYSDSPLDVTYDYRLYSTQILFATASSRLSWPHFSIIGFSLGGGIAMHFASRFPYLIDSLVLLAPGGILRHLPQGYESLCYRYHPYVPHFYLRRLMAALLEVKLSPSDLNTVQDAESQDASDEDSPIRRLGKNGVDVQGIVQWQFDHHQGFTHTFVDGIRAGLIRNQEADWRKVCSIIEGEKAKTSPSEQTSKLFDSKLFLIFGSDDGIVIEKEVVEDVRSMMGSKERIVSRTVLGTHGFPVPSGEAVVSHILDFWA